MMQRAPTVKISNTWRLTLPRDMCEDMGIKPGDVLNMVTSGITIVLTPDDDYAASIEAENERAAAKDTEEDHS